MPDDLGPGQWRRLGDEPTPAPVAPGSERRIGRRTPISGRRVVLHVYQRNRLGFTRLVEHEVPVRDLSVSGAGVEVTGKVALEPGDVVTLGLEGFTGKVAVVNKALLGPDRWLLGLQFLDPHPTFLPVVVSWLDG